MTLSEFITNVGDAKAAVLFGVSEDTARAYRLGWRYPSPERARLIVSKSAGKVDFAGCFASIRRYRPSERAA